MGRLIINGDEIYELDEECLKEKKEKERKKRRGRTFEEEIPSGYPFLRGKNAQ